jgi:nicotinamidase-related amidase
MSLGTSLARSLDPSRTALIVWDLQVGLAGAAADQARLSERIPRLVFAARHAGCRVIWSRHVGAPVDQLSAAQQRIQSRGQDASEPVRPYMPEGSPEGAWVDWISPDAGDLVIPKSHPTFFEGTPLQYLLRAGSIDTLVLCGVATDHGIDLTARHGIALGLTSVVASDATGSFTDQAHQDGLQRLAVTSEVLTVDEIIDIWNVSDDSTAPSTTTD